MKKEVYEAILTAEKLKNLVNVDFEKLKESELFKKSDTLMSDVGKVIGSLNNLVASLEAKAEQLIVEPDSSKCNEKKNKVVLFDAFAEKCPFFKITSCGMECLHKNNEEVTCSGLNCPLGYNADEDDLTAETIDWDGMCTDGDVTGMDYFVVYANDKDGKKALDAYEKYMNRYKGE